MQVAFDGAREQLQVGATCRKARYDHRVKELPLSEGQLVYLRDYGVRHCYKIHDLWSSTVYQVIKALWTGSSVYTVAPVGDLHQVRHVYRSALKPRLQGEAASVDLPESLVDSPVPLETEVELEDGDLAYVVSEVPPLVCEGTAVSMPPLGVVHVTAPLVNDSEVVSTAETSIGLLDVLRPPFPEPSNPPVVVPHQTG